MKVDYLIIGQGICGTLLSRQLLLEGKSVIVIDDSDVSSSSRAAGGIINPVTGKRLVNSWMIDDLLPFAKSTYHSIGEEIGVSIIQQCDILDFHATHEMRSIFGDRLKEDNKYLSEYFGNGKWDQYFRFNYGIGKIGSGMLLNIQTMLNKWGASLQARGFLLQEKFEIGHLKVRDNEVIYKQLTADKVLFCDGVAAADNPYFAMLPWSKDKGEALVASIPGLPLNDIYKQGSISLVPWNSGLFWIGASHDWKFNDMLPSPVFRARVEEQLKYWLRLPYTIEEHIVAQRPANVDRKPFIGLHPLHPSVGIFNGMGGKGCSLAPYFAHQFAKHLVQGSALQPEVDINRYRKVLSRV
jgi:glycine/D-amino acid oxidase-like deaminating enzyme